jgi:hypothetical protein
MGKLLSPIPSRANDVLSLTAITIGFPFHRVSEGWMRFSKPSAELYLAKAFRNGGSEESCKLRNHRRQITSVKVAAPMSHLRFAVGF